jgi:hypothetical protein
MFLALGMAFMLTLFVVGWLIVQLVRAWLWLGRSGSATIQVMTVEERRKEEVFVEHARRRAWKELYMEVGGR